MFKKIIAIGGTLAIAASLSVIAVAGAAEATHPVVSGTAACDTSGVPYITWRVTGDTRYANETATIKVAELTSTGGDSPSQPTSLLEQTVKGAGFVEATQSNATAGAGYSLTVKVQWTNHSTGNLVSQTSDVVTPASCAVPTPEDATASLTKTAATCAVAAELVLGALNNFAWGDITRDGVNYTVTATALDGHRFPAGDGVSGDGLTMVFTGTLDPKKTGVECTPPPDCIPASAVSYTYDGPSNSGTIHVENVPSISGELCEGFWATATSWKYKTDGVWPQTLDVVDYVNGKQKITAPGDYPFEAVITCGQGDVYASFTAQPEPGPILTGPSTPYLEKFLHGMGFTGPFPTWFAQDAGCNVVVPVAPEVTTATECGIAPTVVAKTTDGIDYVVKLDTATGDYVVTATPKANYYFAGDDDQVIKFKGNIGVLVDCVEQPDVVAAFGDCTPGEFDDGLSLEPTRSATLTFDNSASTKPVLFQILGLPEFDAVVAAGESVDVVIENATATGRSFAVIAAGRSFEIPIPACDLPPLALVTPTYSVTQPTCTTSGSYTLGSVVGELTWTVNGVSGVASGTYPAPSNHSDVTISAAPAVAADGLDPDWVNPVVLTFTAPTTGCGFNPPTLSYDPPTLAYTGLTVGTGLSLAGGLLFVGFAGLMVARSRKVQG
ncbi:MAG: hypothetical protein ACOH10_01505 [Rhodoglobus sp.]